METENNQLLRFTTAGSVDDGKSTLIGRLLYDSKSIFEDQLDSIKTRSQIKGEHEVDLAMFTDGLKDEREQGITIDVAYRYFTTPKRKFIIADTPGHIQYTRNMVTGASTANAALLLIDARKGVIEQTRRHSYIASLLQIPHVIVCVNKMDLIDYSETRFNEIIQEYNSIASKMMIKDVRFIPISALKGDNVVHRSKNMEWYQDAPLLHTLETIHIGSDMNKIDARFPVQTVIRPQSKEYIDYRGYAGRIQSGRFKVQDEVLIMPSGFTSKIKSINRGKESIDEAYTPMSISITLEDDIDISRGDMIVRKNNVPVKTQQIDAMICWLGNEAYQPRTKFLIQHTTNEQTAMVTDIVYKIDIETLNRLSEDKNIQMNDIARITLKTAGPLMIDEFNNNRQTGSFILVNPNTNETVAAGMCI